MELAVNSLLTKTAIKIVDAGYPHCGESSVALGDSQGIAPLSCYRCTVNASGQPLVLLPTMEINEVTKTNVIAVIFESRWEEGVVPTDAKLDLDTGIVFDIVDSDAGSGYEHLIGEFVLVGGREVPVELEPDNNYRIDAPTLVAIKMDVTGSTVECQTGGAVESARRIASAVDRASEAFWLRLAEHFPEATGGDLPPDVTMHLDAEMATAARVWVKGNVPGFSQHD